MKLGKKPAVYKAKTLQLAKYLDLAALPPIPPVADWTQSQTEFGAMGNSTVGDCTCATIGHARQIWTMNASTEVTMPDADVLKLYSAITGYTPADPSTDNGAVLLDVLTYVRKAGLLTAFVSVDPRSRDHMRAAVHLFGGVAIGVRFLQGWRGAQVWSVPNGDVEGGHAIFGPLYDADGLGIISWGNKYVIPWDAIDAECDEAYALLSPEWVMPGGMTPAGFDLAALQADLAAVTH